MIPPEGCHLYWERIGAFVLGRLDGWEHASSPPSGAQLATTTLLGR